MLVFKHRYPSMDDLIDTCERKLGKPFSVSTIQKDIKAMKEDEDFKKTSARIFRIREEIFWVTPLGNRLCLLESRK